MYCLVSSVSRSLFSRMSGLGRNGEREKRRNEASWGVMPTLSIFSLVKGTGRQRLSLGGDGSGSLR